MAYTDFLGDLNKVRDVFGLQFDSVLLFENVVEIAPPEWLTNYLEASSTLYLGREKPRSEFLVAPVLAAAREASKRGFAIYSGEPLNADAAQGLVGECDFILTKTAALPVFSAPVMTLVEAKNQDINAGLGQCAAQMYGARIFNQAKGQPISPIFGCVTTGENWQFLKLEDNELKFDNRRYYIDNLKQLLGVFAQIAAHYEN